LCETALSEMEFERLSVKCGTTVRLKYSSAITTLTYIREEFASNSGRSHDYPEAFLVPFCSYRRMPRKTVGYLTILFQLQRLYRAE
jgi:hypothetical protein